MTFHLRSILLLFAAFVIVSIAAQDFEDISPLATVFETTSVPKDEQGNFLPRYMASVGNGHVATTLYTDTVFLNGLYNGFKGESHRARIPSRNNIIVSLENQEVKSETYALDVEKGTFTETKTTDDFEIKVETFAHRFYHKVIVTQITATPIVSGRTAFMRIQSNMGPVSQDIVFQPDQDYDEGTSPGVPSVFTCGETIQVEDPTYQPLNSTACVIARKVHPSQLIMQRTVITFFAAYDTTLAGAKADFDAVAKEVSESKDAEILSSHVKEWSNVWEHGRIEVGGNTQLGKIIYGSLYYILSSLPVFESTNSPVGQFYGLSPGGLGYGTLLSDYQGHSFWDTEIWMYPPMLYLYPKTAKQMLNYRLHVIKAARDRAIETGYKGARFPWEGGFTGREVTPDCCPETRDLQVHITGDISFAIRQYIATTRDLDWLKNTQPNMLTNGCGLLREIAEFWDSRSVCDAGKTLCEINGVMPPDEDNHDVNNSVYTNVMAGYSIFYADYAKCLCGDSMGEIPRAWIQTAGSLKLGFDEELNFHPEFDNYVPGTSIKQADVVLLGYPLMYEMTPEVRRNDLLVYEPVTRPDGPAMTWAMHTIGFLDLDDTVKAEGIFNRSYQSYVRQPYKIWTEAQPPTLGAVNFITGMGGFLQSIISGYGGLRLYPEKIVFSKPRIPPQSTLLRLVGLEFLENEFTLLVEENKITLTFTTTSSRYPPALTNSAGQPIPIQNNVATIDTSSAGPVTFTLTSSTQTECPLPVDKIKYVPVTSPQQPTTKGPEEPSTDMPSAAPTTKGPEEPSTDMPSAAPTTKGPEEPSTDMPSAAPTDSTTPSSAVAMTTSFALVFMIPVFSVIRMKCIN